jgi:YycE-like C-terminal domain
MELRVARHTERLAEMSAFYRDGIGLVEVGGFSDHAETLLVFYLGDKSAVDTVVVRLAADPIEPANPYWAEHGVTIEDPDGFRVVLVPEEWPA